MTPEEEVFRAERAKQLLTEPLIAESLKAIKDAVIEQWRVSPVKDRELRDYLHAMFNAAHKFEELMQSHIETGKLAAAQLRDQNGRRNRPSN